MVRHVGVCRGPPVYFRRRQPQYTPWPGRTQSGCGTGPPVRAHRAVFHDARSAGVQLSEPHQFRPAAVIRGRSGHLRKNLLRAAATADSVRPAIGVLSASCIDYTAIGIPRRSIRPTTAAMPNGTACSRPVCQLVRPNDFTNCGIHNASEVEAPAAPAPKPGDVFASLEEEMASLLRPNERKNPS